LVVVEMQFMTSTPSWRPGDAKRLSRYETAGCMSARHEYASMRERRQWIGCGTFMFAEVFFSHEVMFRSD
jgi:hypothetical protein